MARQTNKGKARHEDAKRIRQVSSKTLGRIETMRTRQKQGKARQGGLAKFTAMNCPRFYLLLSYLCSTFVILN